MVVMVLDEVMDLDDVVIAVGTERSVDEVETETDPEFPLGLIVAVFLFVALGVVLGLAGLRLLGKQSRSGDADGGSSADQGHDR